MDGYRRNLIFLAILVLFAAGGAGCPRMMGQYTALPRMLPQQPSLEQIISVVNQNNSQIQSFSTDRATISVAGSPTLRANIAMQRPGRFFRLQADTALTLGPEFDLGSNDQFFWFWYRGDPGHVFMCRHDQFMQSAARGAIPITPDELIDALGLAQFDPALPHQGPAARPDGRYEICTIRETPEGPVKKLTVVDPGGWIVQQDFYDVQGQLALRAMTRDVRRDPFSNLLMPKVVEVMCPKSGFQMSVNLGNVQVNRLTTTDASLWTMPRYEGAQQVDLGNPNLRFQPMAAEPPGWNRR